MRFGVLGPLAVWTTEGQPVRVPEAKVRALLADLLVQQGTPVSADRLAEDLWAGHPPGNPANTLQTKVSQLRRALDRAEPGARDLVVHQPPGYLLRLDDDALDVQRFRALAARARERDDPAARAALLADALALWRGPALADFAEEPFAAPLVRRLDEERLVALEDRAEARLALGEHDVLAGELADLVAAHPIRERLRGLHMRALYRAGRQAEALAAYAELRAVLTDQLGLEPGPELAGLHQAILRQDPGLAAPAAAAPVPKAGTNLPAPLTELVGRDEAVHTVRTLVGGARLVTLTGSGGVGKTSLAVEVARRLRASMPDGAWLVELAGLDRQRCAGVSCPEEDWIAETVAATLGIRDGHGPATALADRLAEALRGKDLLLVFDNCERLVAPVASLTARLLRAAPGLRVLATSREPLGLAGETLWTVPPLTVPAGGLGREDPLAAATTFSSVRLFAARASASAPDFALTGDNAATVAEICRRLDGIPLALELAATRVRTLGAEQLLDRLDDRFGLLASGHRDAPARQQTLRAMIDWSWQPLTEPERIVLRRLAVHADGCDLEAAEAVCSGEGLRADEVLDPLARLVDRSMVVSQQQEGRPRYRLLESVAAYCLDRAREAGELDRLRERHAGYYLALAERAAPLLRGPGQRAWLRRLDLEAGNLRAAMETLPQQGDAAGALRLASALTWYWFLRGRFGEARRSLLAALAVPGAPATARAVALAWHAGLAVLGGNPVDEAAVAAVGTLGEPGPRARAQWFLGYVLTTVGDGPAAGRLTAGALEGCTAEGDQWGVAAALSDQANQVLARGDVEGARRIAERAAGLFRELGDRWGLLQPAFVLGTIAEVTGDYERAAGLHRESLRAAEELGLWPEVSYQLSWLGRIAMITGDHPRARRLHERAMRLATEQGFTPGEVYAETGLALGARREGRLDDAERHLHAVLAWHRELGFTATSTLILAELGFVAEQRGQPEAALRFQREGYDIAVRGGDPRAVALALEGLAGAHALAGDHERAAVLLGAAAARRRSVGAPLPPAERGDVDRVTAAAGAALGEAAFAAAFDRGGTLATGELPVHPALPSGSRG